MSRGFFNKVDDGNQKTTECHTAEINRVSNAIASSKVLHSINRQGSVSKSVSGCPCFLICYLFIDTQSF